MTWKDVVSHFKNFEVAYAGELKEINNNKTTRTGLEFANYFARKSLASVVLWGKQEFLYLLQFPLAQIIEKLRKIFSLKPPMIVLSKNFKVTDALLSIAKEFNVTIVKTDQSSSTLINDINFMLTEALAKIEYIHGNLMECYGVGVLIIGNSGVGKSETCLELIKKGHMFIADDAVVCKNIYNVISGSQTERFFGFMEVRGIGIINVGRTFGIEKLKRTTHVNIVIELVPFDPMKMTYERLGNEIKYKTILGIKIPYYLLPIYSGRKISDLIEVTVAQYKLIASGYNSFEEFNKIINKNNYESS